MSLATGHGHKLPHNPAVHCERSPQCYPEPVLAELTGNRVIDAAYAWLIRQPAQHSL